MHVRILLILLLILVLAVSIDSASATQPDSDFKLYLVRHAEKQESDDSDPGLTVAGNYRSEQLANWLHDKDIKRIWSSDYKRTRDTAVPFLSEQGLELALYDPRDLPELAKKLLENKESALVVGHSNTTPDLTRLLCQCVINNMDESEYDLLFIVSVFADESKVEILEQSSAFAH